MKRQDETGEIQWDRTGQDKNRTGQNKIFLRRIVFIAGIDSIEGGANGPRMDHKT